MKYNPSCATGGTPMCFLERHASDAVNSLRTAIEFLAAASPNGRDYTEADFPHAQKEHKDMIEQADAALCAMEERVEYLAQKRDEREAQRGR